METVCHNQLRFESLFSKEVIADFAGGRITSDAGGLVLRELDQRYRLAENVARCLHDPREGHKVKHDLLTLVRQRLFAIAQGYEDNNDAATLAKDPAFKIMAGKAPESDGDLASQPTRSRFENRVTAKVEYTHLGDIARAKGMAQIARETGLGRESLYKALSPEGNPEFATVLKVVRALGLRLRATPAHA